MDEPKPPYSRLRSIALGSALADEINRTRKSARNPDSGNAALKIWTTMNNQKRLLALLAYSCVVLVALAAVQGCAVVAVADVVGTVAVKTVGLAADAAIGAVKLTGKAVGAAADAVIPDAK